MFPASQAIVNEAIKQFKLIFNTNYIPDPILTSYRLWNAQEQFGYAVHQWGLNAQDDKVIKQMVQPFEGIFTCNEAWSDMQGWVNGSLRSSNLVLNVINK